MRRVIDQVDSHYLQQAPPRSLSYVVLLNLLGDHIFERHFSAFLDPVLIAGLATLILLIALRTNALLWLVPLAIVVGRLAVGAIRAWRRAWGDLMLLRDGQLLHAHVLRMRPHRNTAGEIDGALLYCAVPVTPQRAHVGSIWLSDGIEAAQLARQGRLAVLCLTRTPGTWRIIEELKSEVRYERVGPMPQLPEDV